MRGVSKSEAMQRAVEAYAGYRLNRHELADLVADHLAGKETEEKLTHYSERSVDWHDQRSPEEVEELLQNLGLDQQVQELDENKVWSRLERSLVRRLQGPEPEAPEETTPSTLNPKFVNTVQSGLRKWDRDGDNSLSAPELDFVMAGGFYGELREEADDPMKAATLATLRRYTARIGAVEPFEPEGVSGSDMAALIQGAQAQDLGLQGTLNEAFEEYYLEAQSLGAVEWEKENISPDQIRQGVPGSCVFLSTLQGRSDEQLRSMLTPEENGFVRVTFGDGSEELVTSPTLAERLFHAQGEDGQAWVASLERAMGQKLYREKSEEKERSVRLAIDGIEPETALEAVTGKKAEKFNLDEMSLAQTRQRLAQVANSDAPVICGSRPNALRDFISVEELHNGIVNGHAYTIKQYDAENDMVTLQNPWHKQEWIHAEDGHDDGVFQMPARDFYCSFRWIASEATAA